MRRILRLIGSIVLIISCLSLLCTRPQILHMPFVSVVIGNAGLARGILTSPLISRQQLKAGDTVIVSKNSKVKLVYQNGCSLYLNCNTAVTFSSIDMRDGEEPRIPISVLKGEFLYVHNDTSGFTSTYLFKTPKGTIIASEADLFVSFNDTSKVLSVLELSGSCNIESANSESLRLESCNHFILDQRSSSRIIPASENDFQGLREWAGSTVVDGLLDIGGCFQQAPVAENLPPEWKNTPLDVCKLGEYYLDTIRAADPEERGITYSIIKGPEGMTLDSAGGVIRFRPTQPGAVTVIIRATDADSQFAEMEYSISVTAQSELTAVIEAPRMVKPGEPFVIKASSTRRADNKKLLCRFDLDGDGKFDSPESGKFAPSLSKTCVFKKEGEYRIAAELIDSSGRRASAKRLVIVDQPPTAAIEITPSFGTVNTDFQLDISGSFDSLDLPETLEARFDTDGDGVWDLPPDGKFFKEKTIPFKWNKPGQYRVAVQINDSHGLSDTAYAEITVNRDFAVDSISGLNNAHIGDTINFECIIANPEFQVALYEWNMDGDTGFEKKTSLSHIEYAFGKSGKFLVKCRVTDKNGQIAEQQKMVTIENTSCTVNAGGPYKAAVNSEVTLEGKVVDPDSRIVKYTWDFDGDARPDWSSQSTSRTTHSFAGSGRYIACLTVETDDGRKASDTAVVEITNKPPVAEAGDDLVSRANRKVTLNGIGKDPEGGIALYEWDFDADGKFDWSSNENGTVEHEFNEYSTAVLRVMDSDSMTSIDSMKVIICPEDMELIEKGKFCIDKYEWPNKKGLVPEMDASYEDALEKCARTGKQLCTSEQWETACTDGLEKKDYPYGRGYKVDRCNTLGNPFVKNKPAVSGYFTECGNASGVYDMSGNGAEWTQTSEAEPYAYGGSWQNGENGSKCNSRVQLQKHRKYFYVGFRCCK